MRCAARPFITLAKRLGFRRLTAHFVGNMDLSCSHTILALGAPAQPGQQAPPAWTSFVPMILLVVVFYFILIRPQQKKQRTQEVLLKAIS